MIRRPPRSTQSRSSAASDVYKRQLIDAVAEGKGVIVVLPHYGSWEAGAVYLSSLSPFAAVAEVLKPPELFDLFVKLRAGVGIKIFPYDHSAETRDEMVSALRQGIMLALLCAVSYTHLRAHETRHDLVCR